MRLGTKDTADRREDGLSADQLKLERYGNAAAISARLSEDGA